ncbi:MAG TPA: type II secretion system secretin GspD [Armatimonadota bacterium]|nr:type II secretion system secretin GspD [Armatimonadota bacterium]
MRRTSLAIAVLALGLLLLPAAHIRAQPAEVVTLDVRGLDIDNLLQFYSRVFGLTVVKDPNLTGAVTIMCPEPVSRQEALDILNSVLEVRGFTSIRQGSLLKVVPLAKAVQSNVGLTVGRSPGAEGDQVVTQLIPLRGADAAQLQAELAPLVTTGASIIGNSASNTLVITDYASNIARLLQVIEQVDSANAGQVRVFPLAYADASDVASLLTQMFFTAPRGAATTAGGAQLPGWQRRLLGAAAATSGGRAGTATAAAGQAVADTRTNAVLVSTSKERLEAIAEVIQSLDRPVERQGNLTVVALERANATDVANALNQALGGRASSAARTTTTTRTAQPTTRTTSASQRTGATTRAFDDASSSRAEEPTSGSADSVVAQVAPPPAAAAAAAGAQSANVIELGGNVSVVAEPNTNSLIISAPPEYALLMKQLIAQLDQAPPQVLIEAIVAEVALDTERKLGFEWSWTEHRHLGNDDLTGTVGTDLGAAQETLGFRYSIAGASLNTLLHALATDDKVTILSTPRIFTSNNRPAEINISTQTPYVSSVRTTDTTETFSVQYLDVGVILTVTPQIAPDGTVTMQVTQEANELLGFQSFGTVQAPTVARRSAQATIRVADGQTAILGGIISNNSRRLVSKVPVLGDLPLLGNLFRHSTVTNKRSELLVFLTPKVVRTAEETTALTRGEQERSIVPLPTTTAPKGSR